MKTLKGFYYNVWRQFLSVNFVFSSFYQILMSYQIMIETAKYAYNEKKTTKQQKTKQNKTKQNKNKTKNKTPTK